MKLATVSGLMVPSSSRPEIIPESLIERMSDRTSSRLLAALCSRELVWSAACAPAPTSPDVWVSRVSASSMSSSCWLMSEESEVEATARLVRLWLMAGGATVRYSVETELCRAAA